MDIPEKLATQGTQDEEQKHNAVSVGHHYTQANTNNKAYKSWKLSFSFIYYISKTNHPEFFTGFNDIYDFHETRKHYNNKMKQFHGKSKSLIILSVL
jgi:hypothetical protein